MKTLPKTWMPVALLLLLTSLAAGAHMGQASASQTSASMPMHEVAKKTVPSKQLIVTYDGRTITLTAAELLALPQQTVTVTNGHTGKSEQYSGPLVADVLARAGLQATGETHQRILHSTIVATGADGYFVLYAAAEVEPSFATGKVIVALMKDGLPDEAGGTIQLVNTTDAKPARWVHGLAQLSVMTLDRSK